MSAMRAILDPSECCEIIFTTILEAYITFKKHLRHEISECSSGCSSNHSKSNKLSLLGEFLSQKV